MPDLESQLIKSQGLRNKIIVTDGVFSMDGDIAKMNEICDLADKYRCDGYDRRVSFSWIYWKDR